MKIGLYVMNKAVASKYSQILYLFKQMSFDERFEIVGLYDKDNIDFSILDHFIVSYDLRKYDINSLGLSAIIVNDPYSRPIIPYDEIKVPIIYKEYGVAGVEKGYGSLLKKKIYQRADMIITESDFTSEIIRSKYPSSVVITGSPAFDYARDPYFEKFDDKSHIVWTPHHSIVKETQYDNIIGDAYSTFLEIKDYITGEFLDKYPNVVLHIKYHPVLVKRYNQFVKSVGGSEDFNQFIKRISKNPRIIVHTDGDYQKLFMKCDLCINDSLSFIQEWLPTEKPMIVLRNGAEYSSFGESLVNDCYYPMTVSEFINYDLNKFYDIKRPERYGFLINHGMVGLEKNCTLIKDFIWEGFNNEK